MSNADNNSPQNGFEELQKKIDAQLKGFGIENIPPATPPTQGQHEMPIPDGFDVEVVDGKMVFKKKEEPPGILPAPGTPEKPPEAPPKEKPPEVPKPPEDDEKKKMLELLTEMKGTMDKMKIDYDTKTSELEKKLAEANAGDVPVPLTTPPPVTPPVIPPPITSPPIEAPPGELQVPGTSTTPGEGRFWNGELGKYEDFSDGYVPHMGAAMLLKFKNAGGSFGGAQPDSI